MALILYIPSSWDCWKTESLQLYMKCWLTFSCISQLDTYASQFCMEVLDYNHWDIIERYAYERRQISGGSSSHIILFSFLPARPRGAPSGNENFFALRPLASCSVFMAFAKILISRRRADALSFDALDGNCKSDMVLAQHASSGASARHNGVQRRN